MAKRGGFSGGMPGNMSNLMKQAQRMQKKLEEGQKALSEKEFKATSGGGAVEVVLTGDKRVRQIKISPEAVDPEETELLEEMLAAALNEAQDQIDAESEALMGGMGSLGGMPF